MKKLLSLLLCAAMLFGLLLLSARAASDAWDGTVDISWYDPAKTEYEIDTPAKLAGLAALVNGMADPTAKKIVGNMAYLVSKKVDNVMLVGAGGGNVFDTVYTGGIDFAYKTIYLTADLDMGGRKGASGSWTGPNWTPIGGKFPMKPAEANGDCMTLDTRFNGILDGQGHTIYNLYCNRYAAKGFPYSMAVGVVGFLGGNADYANGVSGERSEAEFVTLDALLTDADVTFADGDSLSFVCDGGPYTKFNPTYKDITEGKYYFKDGKAEEVPAALALVWGAGAAANGTVAGIAKTAKEAGLRFVCGTTEADFTEEKAAGKRMLSGVMALIVVSAAKAEEKPAEETKTGFTDVLDTDWFKADVEKAVESKLMTGTSATAFSPKGVTTRAMVVATLYRLAGSPEVTEKAAFTDVVSGSYYEAAVAWAARNAIASGTSETTFEPNKAVTREQLAKFLFNYAVYQGMDAVTLSENLSSFSDQAEISAYAVSALQWAVGAELIKGSDGKLQPAGTATRCQFAALLNRFAATQKNA